MADAAALLNLPAWATLGSEVEVITRRGEILPGRVVKTLKRDLVVADAEGAELVRVRRDDYDARRDRYVRSVFEDYSRTHHGSMYPPGHPEVILARARRASAAARAKFRALTDAYPPPGQLYGSRRHTDDRAELDALEAIRSSLDALAEAVACAVQVDEAQAEAAKRAE